ncbi:MAG: chorismate mutase / prephenate dehydratase, partial [Eubacteriaceae bacterium]|nr:chorismate mutase / prephenate dehydratase [Eubacteriaceae bacterium]
MGYLDDLNQAFSTYPYPLEENPKVAFAGTAGSYGEQAALSFFKNKCSLSAFQNFDEVFACLEEGQCDYGVLPIENSSTGSIASVYDLLSRYHYYIIGEEEVRVKHCLLAPPGATLKDIREVYSHP